MVRSIIIHSLILINIILIIRGSNIGPVYSRLSAGSLIFLANAIYNVNKLSRHL